MKLFTRISRTVRLAALVLALAMLFSMQGMPVLAQAAGSSDVHRILTKSSIENPSYYDSFGGGVGVLWDVVKFGSYPQTEVKGSALTAAITGASYDNNGDAWVGGVKYRRISKKDTNNSTFFGSGTYRYFKWKDIEWDVLKNDGSTVFLATSWGIDCKKYHEAGGDVTWADCTLRSWMNGTFYNTAFSSDDKKAIVSQNVVNADNPVYGTPGGKNTQDNVYALSSADVTNPEYGFRESLDKVSVGRMILGSDYARAMGASVSRVYSDCFWWLRTPGKSANNAIEMSSYGNVVRYDSDVDTSNTAVRPALHVKLSYLTGNPAGDNAPPAEKYDQKITYSTAKIKKGKVVYGTKPFPLHAESSGYGGLSYASSDTSVLTVNTAGKVTVKGCGRVTITITAAATDNYNRTSRLVDLTVVPKKAEITDGGLKNGKAYFNWKKDSTVSGYQFCWASNQAFTKNVKKKSVKGTSIKLPVSDKTMYVRVRAYKKAGSQTYYGDWSGAWRV